MERRIAKILKIITVSQLLIHVMLFVLLFLKNEMISKCIIGIFDDVTMFNFLLLAVDLVYIIYALVKEISDGGFFIAIWIVFMMNTIALAIWVGMVTAPLSAKVEDSYFAYCSCTSDCEK